MFIMSEKKAEDHVLDELLNNMPQFTDNRPKDEIYHQVRSQLESLERSGKTKRIKVSINRWLPLIISIASVLILTVLVSSYVNNNQSFTADKASKSFMSEDKLRTMEVPEEAAMDAEKNSSDMTSMTGNTAPTLELAPFNRTFTSVYEQDINGDTVFHFSLIENALSVPITIVISKEQIAIDFPNSAPNSLELYNRYALEIDETSLGFQEYHPYKGHFLEEGKVLTHYLPIDHGYDAAPGTAEPYISSINEIFTDFESLLRVNEDGSPIEWDQVGILDEPLMLSGSQKKVNYFAYKAFNNETYLTPNFNKSYDTLTEALMAMKNPENGIYTSVIPNDMTYTIKGDKEFVMLFDKPLNLESLDESEASHMIEALSLTAASFNQSLRLENVVQETWNEIDFTRPLPVPIGPNGFTMQPIK